MNWKRALLPALVIAPLLIVLGVAFRYQPNALPSVLVGRPAPSFSLQTLDGDTVHSDELRGKPVVLNFWSTWCVPCKVEHDFLQVAAAKYGDRVHFFGVVYQDTPEAARTYLAHKTDRYPHLIDPSAQVAIEHGISGVPESFFIDAGGIIKHKQIGVVTPELLESQLRDMLNDRSL